jgi:hypothetical protein
MQVAGILAKYFLRDLRNDVLLISFSFWGHLCEIGRADISLIVSDHHHHHHLSSADCMPHGSNLYLHYLISSSQKQDS